MPMLRIGAFIGGAFALLVLADQPATAGETECTDADCMVEAVERCESAVYVSDASDEIGARGRYRVLGPEESGACRIEFTFLENPNPSWVDRPFTFLVDPSLSSEEMILGAVEACLTGGEDWYQCKGPLIELVTGVAEPSEGLVAGTGPLPCGQAVGSEAPALYPMPENGQWGYVDRDGSWQIAPQWPRARDFHEGRAAVGGPSGWGIIDREGNEILPTQYQAASYVTIDGRNWYDSPFSPYSEGCTVMTHFTDMEQPSFFVDRQGHAYWRDGDRPEALAGDDLRYFGVFSEGLAWFQNGIGNDARYGWVNADGEIVIEPEFVAAGTFSEGLAFAAVREGQGAYIDPDGQPVLPRKWTLYDGAPFSDGLARVKTGAFDIAYWTTSDVAFDSVDFGSANGERPAEASIGDEAGHFRDGLAPVVTGFSDGDDLAYVRRDGSVAFVPDELDGIAVCNRRALPEFHNGLVRLLVADDGDTCGEGNFYAERARYEAAHYVYLDNEGKVVLRQKK